MEFDHLLQRWQTDDRIASAAEQAMEAELDAWCEGHGAAPAPAVIAGVRGLRAAALADWGRLYREVDRERRALRTL